MARVSVPATSANLGPGFDCLGLALDLRDELDAFERGERPEPRVLSADVVDADGEVHAEAGQPLTEELARALRGRGEQVPILLLTARSVREDVLEAMEAGVNTYLVKPFTPQVLKQKIDALLPAAA